MDLTQTTTLTGSGHAEETVERDGVRMTKAEAKDAAEERFKAGQEAAANDVPFATFSELDAESEAYADFKAGCDSPFKQADWEVELAGNAQDL